MMRHYMSIEERLRECRSRRDVLEQKAKLREATQSEFRQLEIESRKRLYQKTKSDYVMAKNRNRSICDDVTLAVHSLSISDRPNDYDLRDAAAINFKRTDENLKNALADYHQALQNKANDYKIYDHRLYEEKLHKIQMEKKAIDERRRRLQEQFQYENQMKTIIENEKEKLILNLALEQKEIMELKAQSLIRQSNHNILEQSILQHLQRQDKELNDYYQLHQQQFQQNIQQKLQHYLHINHLKPSSESFVNPFQSFDSNAPAVDSSYPSSLHPSSIHPSSNHPSSLRTSSVNPSTNTISSSYHDFNHRQNVLHSDSLYHPPYEYNLHRDSDPSQPHNPYQYNDNDPQQASLMSQGTDQMHPSTPQSQFQPYNHNDIQDDRYLASTASIQPSNPPESSFAWESSSQEIIRPKLDIHTKVDDEFDDQDHRSTAEQPSIHSSPREQSQSQSYQLYPYHEQIITESLPNQSQTNLKLNLDHDSLHHDHENDDEFFTPKEDHHFFPSDQQDSIVSQTTTTTTEATIHQFIDQLKSSSLLYLIEQLSSAIESKLSEANIDTVLSVFSKTLPHHSITLTYDQAYDFYQQIIQEEKPNDSNFSRYDHAIEFLAGCYRIIIQVLGDFLIPTEILNGIVTLERLKKEQKRLGGGRVEVWSLFLNHLRKYLAINQRKMQTLSMGMTGALVHHVPCDDRGRAERKVLSLLQLAMISSSGTSTAAAEGGSSINSPVESKKIDTKMFSSVRPASEDVGNVEESDEFTSNLRPAAHSNTSTKSISNPQSTKFQAPKTLVSLSASQDKYSSRALGTSRLNTSLPDDDEFEVPSSKSSTSPSWKRHTVKENDNDSNSPYKGMTKQTPNTSFERTSPKSTVTPSTIKRAQQSSATGKTKKAVLEYSNLGIKESNLSGLEDDEIIDDEVISKPPPLKNLAVKSKISSQYDDDDDDFAY